MEISSRLAQHLPIGRYHALSIICISYRKRRGPILYLIVVKLLLSHNMPGEGHNLFLFNKVPNKRYYYYDRSSLSDALSVRIIGTNLSSYERTVLIYCRVSFIRHSSRRRGTAGGRRGAESIF